VPFTVGGLAAVRTRNSPGNLDDLLLAKGGGSRGCGRNANPKGAIRSIITGIPRSAVRPQLARHRSSSLTGPDPEGPNDRGERPSRSHNHPPLGRFICLKEGAGEAGPLLQTDNSNHLGEVNRVRGRNVMGSFGRLRELLGSRRAGTSGDELLELGGEVTDVEYIVVAEQHRAFHGVPQLSNVSRPSVGLQSIDGARRDAGDGIRGAGVDLSDERPDESGDVGGTLAEGG